MKIIIPSNNIFNLRKCVESILKTHPNFATKNIIVVDDGAKAYWAGEDPDVAWVRGKKPFIYARNVNLGINEADREDVVILGDDVSIKADNTFDFMKETSERMSVAAVSASVIGDVGNPHQRHDYLIVKESPLQLCFVCVYLPRKWLDTVGLLDEQFDGYGCEDVDWCFRAQEFGGRFLVDGRAIVFHNHFNMKSAFRSKDDCHEKSRHARRLLQAKWPNRDI